MKIMAIVDRHGLPLSVSTHAANHHEVRLVQLCFDFYMIEAKPEDLIGDRAYDSDHLGRLAFLLRRAICPRDIFRSPRRADIMRRRNFAEGSILTAAPLRASTSVAIRGRW